MAGESVSDAERWRRGTPTNLVVTHCPLHAEPGGVRCETPGIDSWLAVRRWGGRIGPTAGAG